MLPFELPSYLWNIEQVKAEGPLRRVRVKQIQERAQQRPLSREIASPTWFQGSCD